ncbi:hypothetical protein HDU83_007210 [Entophlyctis luteolus]|nr:hypothetical protein HDU83_007210 [Entophlyctis luteolus]
MAASMTSVVLVARALRLHPHFGLLMAAGTGVCGVTAISTVAPVIKAQEEHFAIAIANVVLFGMLAVLVYPTLAHWLFFAPADDDTTSSPASDSDATNKNIKSPGLSPSTKAGLFLGVCIHDSAQVIAAAMSFRDAYGNDTDAFNSATVAKLTRNMLLVGVVPILAIANQQMHNAGTGVASAALLSAKHPPLVPLFVVGFLTAAALRSLGDAYFGSPSVSQNKQEQQQQQKQKLQWERFVLMVGDTLGTKVCLGTALAALGLNASLAGLRRAASPKTFVVGGIGAAVAALTGFACIEVMDWRLRALT